MAETPAPWPDACTPPVYISSESVRAAQRLPHPPARRKAEHLRLGRAQEWRCPGCQQLLDEHSHVDHIVPWCIYPDDADRNVQVLCPNCHAAKTLLETMRIRHVTRSVIHMRPHYGMCWRCLGVCDMRFEPHKKCPMRAAPSTDPHARTRDARGRIRWEPSSAERSAPRRPSSDR